MEINKFLVAIEDRDTFTNHKRFPISSGEDRYRFFFSRRASMNDNIFSITFSLLIQQSSEKRPPWLETMTTLLQLCRIGILQSFFDSRFDYSQRFNETILPFLE